MHGLKYLWSHITQSAAASREVHRFEVFNGAAHAKVRNFDLALVINQNIVGLQIAVNHVPGVKVKDS